MTQGTRGHPTVANEKAQRREEITKTSQPSQYLSQRRRDAETQRSIANRTRIFRDQSNVHGSSQPRITAESVSVGPPPPVDRVDAPNTSVRPADSINRPPRPRRAGSAQVSFWILFQQKKWMLIWRNSDTQEAEEAGRSCWKHDTRLVRSDSEVPRFGI